MTRRIVFALACVLVFARPAAAADPEPTNGIIPSHIALVASANGVADSTLGQFTVTVRDLANNPVAGSHVIVAFDLCPQLRIASQQLDERLVVDCGSRTVTAITNVQGVATFTILGSSNGQPGTLGPQMAHVYCDAGLMGMVPVSAFDLDGTGGVVLRDLATWSADWASNVNPGRSDYNNDGAVTLSDLSLWARAYFSNRENTSSSTCP